jgi:hypothetical protein
VPNSGQVPIKNTHGGIKCFNPVLFRLVQRKNLLHGVGSVIDCGSTIQLVLVVRFQYFGELGIHVMIQIVDPAIRLLLMADA